MPTPQQQPGANESYHFTPTPLVKAGGLWPVGIGRRKIKPAESVSPLPSTNYRLGFVIRGSGLLVHPIRPCLLAEGDIFCVFPMMEYEFQAHPPSVLQLIWLEFAGKQAAPLLRRIGIGSKAVHAPGKITNQVRGRLGRLLLAARETGQGGEGRQGEGDEQDLLRLSHIFGLFHTLARSKKDDAVGRNGRSHDSWLNDARTYMAAHYPEGITVEDTAAHVGVDRTHFSKKFRRAFGMPPSKFLQMLRMNEAARLLKETADPISRISHTVGFPDVYAFSRAFKNYFAEAPNRYRNG
ncbi:MAG: AraC family transcriptional regulator [Paenibacillaceae bacterium]|jgi:AraC-like DNA-binding protein|nr:AraC family transcriptional regulator [Paenibacillaceae bacterium]